MGTLAVTEPVTVGISDFIGGRGFAGRMRSPSDPTDRLFPQGTGCSL